MKHHTRLLLFAVALVLLPSEASALTDCTFTTDGTQMRLTGDCTTDATLLVPDGFTLNGRGFSITAVDPPAGHFVGGVVSNAGAAANVTNLIIDTAALANVCDGGADRLRGILFNGASGKISNNTVVNINQGPSGCQEGNAIEVRNAPFDGTHPATKVVTISRNRIFDWQKTGIVANGDVRASIENNIIGTSATQANLAANSIQIGYGGRGDIEENLIEGNTWCCVSDAATAILLYDASPGVGVEDNNINFIGGNADVGIYIGSNGADVKKNRVFDLGADGFYDIGIGNYGLSDGPGVGAGNIIAGNKVRCYDIPFDSFSGVGNTVLPCLDPGGSSVTNLTAKTVKHGRRSPSPIKP